MRRLIARRMGLARGTNQGGAGTLFDKAAAYGLSQFSAANWFQTQVGGGERGVGTGFGIRTLVRFASVASLNQVIVHSFGASDGWYKSIAGINLRGVVVGSPASNTYALVPSDAGKIFDVCLYFTGTAIRLLVDGTQFGADVATAGYTPSTVAMAIGLWTSQPFTQGEVLAVSAFRGQPSAYQLLQVALQTRALGDLPATFPLGTATDADIAALAPRHWYRMDTFTESGGNLAGLTNRNATVGGVLNVAAGTIALPAADAAMNGQPSIALTGTQWLISSLLANEFKFLHSGAGFESFFIYTPTDVSTSQVQLATTRPGSLMDPGAQGTIVQVGTTLSTFRVGNGTATPPILTSDAPFALVNGTATYTNASYTETPSVGIEYFFADRNVVARSGNSAAAPSTADPYRTLVVGAGAITFDGPLRGRVADILLFDRVLTEAERQTVRDYIRVRYGIGQITTTHRWSLRDVLRAQNRRILDNELAPASLPDTVTGAAIDRMDRQGSPVVRVIDAGVDGRKSFGAMGFSGSAYLASGNGLGFRGVASGFTVRCVVTFWSASSGNEFFATCNNASASIGWSFQQNGGALNALVGGGAARISTLALTTADIGRPRLVHLVMDAAGVVTLYLDGVAGTPSGTGAWTEALASTPMILGNSSSLALPATTKSVHELAGCNYIASAAEVAADFAAWQAQGQLAPIPGKPDLHSYPITQDVIANGGPAAGIPAQVLDRIGTDHLTRVGGLRVQDGGLASFSVAQYVRTLGSAVLPGSATFWAECLVDLAAGGITPSASLFGQLAFDLLTGWGFQTWGTDGSPLIRVSLGDGVTANHLYATATLARHHVAVRYTASVATLFLDGVLVATSPAFVFAPASAEVVMFGARRVSAPAQLFVVGGLRGGSGGNFAPTDGEIATAAAAALATGKVAGIPGKTDVRWSLVDDVAEAGGKVPAIAKERVSGTANMITVGAPLQVASRTERLWSYEAQPILYGADSLGDAAYYEAPSGGAGNTLAFWGTLVFTAKSTATSATRIVLSAVASGPTCGWEIRTAGTNATMSMIFVDSAFTGRASGIGTLGANLAGKICVWSFAWDGPNNKLYTWLNRAVAGSATGAAITGYASPPGAIRLGCARQAAGSPATDLGAYSFVLGSGLPTSAVFQAQHDAIMAADGRIQPIAGMSTMMVDVTADALENGGVLPATLKDRIGNNHMARTGAPTTYPQQARSFGW